jgi:hypothetical protein
MCGNRRWVALGSCVTPGRWEAKLVAHLLATATLWVRIHISLKKNIIWAMKVKEWPTLYSPPKKYTKDVSSVYPSRQCSGSGAGSGGSVINCNPGTGSVVLKLRIWIQVLFRLLAIYQRFKEIEGKIQYFVTFHELLPKI